MFGGPRAFAASTLALTLPGLRLLHEGQLEGRRKKLSVHLGRRPDERRDGRAAAHYHRLLAALSHEVFQEGRWRLLEAHEAWPGDSSSRDFVASAAVLRVHASACRVRPEGRTLNGMRPGENCQRRAGRTAAWESIRRVPRGVFSPSGGVRFYQE